MHKKLFHVRIADAEAQLLAGVRPRDIAAAWAAAARTDAQLFTQLLPSVAGNLAEVATGPAVYAAALLFVQGVRRRLITEGRLDAAGHPDPDEGAPEGAPPSGGLIE